MLCCVIDLTDNISHKYTMESKVFFICLVLVSGSLVRASHDKRHQSKRTPGVYSRCQTSCFDELSRCTSGSYDESVCAYIEENCVPTCLYFYQQGYSGQTDCQNACNRHIQRCVSGDAPEAVCDYIDANCVPLCLATAG